MPGDMCRVIPKRIEKHEIRMMEEEIDEAEFLAFLYDLSYEQLFVKLVKDELNRNFHGLNIKEVKK